MAQSRNKGRFSIIPISFAAIILLIMGVYISHTSEGPAEEEQLPGAFLKPQVATRAPGQSRNIITISKPIIPEKQNTPLEDSLIKPRGAAAAKLPRITVTTTLKFADFAIERAATSKVQVISELEGVVRSPARSSYPSIGRSIMRSSLKDALLMRRISDSVWLETAKTAFIDESPVERLPRGEPGGRVIGSGKDIRGYFRVVRIKHSLADWWADQSSLIALINWLNTNTKIKTDI